MRKKCPLRINAAALTFLLAAGPLLAQEVDGRVLEDTSGDPVVSAELRFHKAGMRELAADLETDRDGHFQASGLAAGDYTVEVSKSNHIATSLKLSVPAAGLTLRLVRYAIIAGTVRDTQGQPVPGHVSLPGGRTGGSARVAVLVKQNGSEELIAVRTQPLEDDGRYRIYDLPPGEYAVGLWWAGLPVGSGAQMYPDNSHPRFFEVAGGEEYRDIDFLVVSGPSFTVSGKVEGATPKMKYSLTLGLRELPALPVAQQLWTEDDGKFSLEKVPPGTYDLYAAGPTSGYGAFGTVLGPNPVYGRVRIQVIGQNIENLTIPVSAGRSVDVVLHGSADGCPKTAQVTLNLLEPWGLMGSSRTQANFDKPQAVRDLAPARYGLTIDGLGASCYAINRPVVDLSREVSAPVSVELAPAGRIRGTLRAGTASPRDFAVTLLGDDTAASASLQLGYPDDKGRFEFAGLRPGRYRIAAQPAAGPARLRWVADIAHMMEIEVPGGTPTDVELPVSKGGAQ